MRTFFAFVGILVLLAVCGIVYFWLFGLICRTWHLPFWGMFWLLTLSGSSAGIANGITRRGSRT